MKEALLTINIILSVAIVALVLLQGRGAGMGSAWGGQGEMYHSRRGVESFTMKLTYIAVVIFFLVSLGNFFLK